MKRDDNGDISKCRRVTLKHLQIYAKPELGNRCVVGCFQLYLSLITKEHCVAHLPGFHASG